MKTRRFKQKSIFIMSLLAVMALNCGQLFCASRASAVVIFSGKKEIFKTVWNSCKESLGKGSQIKSFQEFDVEEQREDEIISSIESNKPGIVFVFGTAAYELAKRRISDVPVVFSVVYSSSEKSPRPNITGISIKVSEKDKIPVLKKVFPGIKRIGVFYSDESMEYFSELNRICADEGIEVVARKVDHEKDFPVKLSEIVPNIDLFYLLPDNKIYFAQSIRYLLLEGVRRKFPIVGLSSFFTKAGTVMSMECDYDDIGKQTAEAAEMILNGTPPAAINIRMPRKVVYSLNLQVAERIGRDFSQRLIDDASEVFGK